jgi:hypothetical protein
MSLSQKEMKERVNGNIELNITVLMDELRKKDEYIELFDDAHYEAIDSFIVNCEEDFEDEFDGDRGELEESYEVLEWYVVSTWLYNRLEERGEVVLDNWGLKIWGRRCSGQAVFLDSIMSEIFDLESEEEEGDIDDPRIEGTPNLDNPGPSEWDGTVGTDKGRVIVDEEAYKKYEEKYSPHPLDNMD